RESSGMGTRFLLGALPVTNGMESQSVEQFAKWYRHCVEVRDTQGAERVLLTAMELGSTDVQLADMMMAAVTDHFYINTGHTLDFHNKAFEIVEHIGEEYRPYVLTSLLPGISNVSRSEESHSWQSPVNLVKPLNEAFEKLEDTLKAENSIEIANFDENTLVEQLLSDRPIETIQMMVQALESGLTPVRLAQLVS
ncbi:hypothetical protein, partial [Amycolatopsis sp. w19]|uniref:hypothetical protein n=1 Tax=Amycolatopsis sp. w19 TaxID=3448134 RepID=UPI003F527BE5